MDEQRFDAALRALHRGTTRRTGLAAMLAVLLGGAGLGATASAADGPTATGPCGSGSARDNKCKKNGDCCTNYCSEGECRLKPNYMTCRNDSECLSKRCVSGRCDGGCRPADGRCEENFNCCDGLICKNGACARSSKATCTKTNCPGCCDGTTCRVGASSVACGTNAAACTRCRDGKTCSNGTCDAGCSRSTCPQGCCKDGVCKKGTSNSACGTGGGACAKCTGSKTCQGGICKAGGGGGGCSADTCPTGCCQNGTCKPGDQTAACGTGGVACDACSGATPNCTAGVCSPPNWHNLTTFGTNGTGPSNFRAPNGVALSSDELTAWVADTANHRISVWTRPDVGSTAWANQTTFGSGPGSGPSQLDNPMGVSVTGDALTVVIADRSRVSVWTRPDVASTNWTNQTTFGTSGTSNPDEFQSVYGVAVSSDGLTVWAADPGNHRISVWTRPDTTTNATDWTNQTTFGTSGAGSGNLKNPSGVFASSDGLTTWVADRTNNRISVWTRPDTTTNATAWTEQTTFGSAGTGPDSIAGPTGVFASADGLTLWIAAFANSRISIWTRPDPSSTDWTNKTTFGTLGSGPENLTQPFSVAVSSDGLSAWVADMGNNRISIWTYS